MADDNQLMRCPECVRTGQRSKLYMPNGYSRTCMGGTQTFYDEDGHRHHHEVNSSHGQGRCSEGHLLNVRLSDKCPAPGCDYGSPQRITYASTLPAEPKPGEREFVEFKDLTIAIPSTWGES